MLKASRSLCQRRLLTSRISGMGLAFADMVMRMIWK